MAGAHTVSSAWHALDTAKSRPHAAGGGRLTHGEASMLYMGPCSHRAGTVHWHAHTDA